MSGSLQTRLTRYVLGFLGWTAAGLFLFSQELTRRIYWNDPTPRTELFVSWMIGIYILAAATPPTLWLGRRFPIDSQRWVRSSALHLLFSIFFSIVELALEAALFVQFGILPWLFQDSFRVTFSTLLVLAFHSNMLGYWTVLGIQHGFRYYHRFRDREREALRLELRASELSTQLAQAQLNALKMQLQPHFLFNTLNALMVLIRQGNTRDAEETLDRLSDLLRWVLDDVDAQEVPLRRELEFIGLYLRIEQVRFRDRLTIDISAAPDVLDAGVPHMCLQPLVENAIRHGIGKSSLSGLVKIRAWREADMLHIEITDDGPGFPGHPMLKGHGIGLANTRARLRQFYGDTAQLSTGPAAGGGASVAVRVPFREIESPGPAEVIGLHAADSADCR